MSGGRQPGNVVKNAPQTSGRAKVWSSMRILTRFNTRELVITAEAKVNNVQDYIQRLRAAGYLRLVAPGVGGLRREAVYQLVRNTGPLAPITRKTGYVYDPNEQKVYAPIWDPEATDV